MKKVKFKALGKYDGHSFKANGAVDLKLKFGFDELLNYYVQLPLLRSVDVTLLAKFGDKKPFKLGTYMLKSFTMDHDGEGKVALNSHYDYVEVDNMSQLVADKDALVCFMFRADIEEEEESEES